MLEFEHSYWLMKAPRPFSVIRRARIPALCKSKLNCLIPTTTIPSPRQGTMLARLDPRSQVESTLPWVLAEKVEPYCTGLLPRSSTTLCKLYLVLISVGLPTLALS